MTLRYKVGCTICNQKYLMRISVGHSEKQSHIIECNECKTITSPINNLNYGIILYGKNRCKKIITQRVV